MKKKLARHSELRKEGVLLCAQGRALDPAADEALHCVMEKEGKQVRARADVVAAQARGESAERERAAYDQVSAELIQSRENRRQLRTVQLELRKRAELLNNLGLAAYRSEHARARSRASIPTHTMRRARSSHRTVVRTVAGSAKASAGPDPDPEHSRRAASSGGAR